MIHFLCKMKKQWQLQSGIFEVWYCSVDKFIGLGVVFFVLLRCAGFLFQKVGKLAATAVGGGFLLLQVCSISCFISWQMLFTKQQEKHSCWVEFNQEGFLSNFSFKSYQSKTYISAGILRAKETCLKISGKLESTVSCKIVCSKPKRNLCAETEMLYVTQYCQIRGTACKPLVREIKEFSLYLF